MEKNAATAAANNESRACIVKTFTIGGDEPASQIRVQIPEVSGAVKAECRMAAAAAAAARSVMPAADCILAGRVMCVDLTQRSSSDLGSFLWPSSLLLSDFIHHNMRDQLQGKTVLEVRPSYAS